MMTGLFKKIQATWKHWHTTSGVKNFKEIQIKEHAYDAKLRGTRPVPLDQIVGSVGRYRDFDTQFRLKQHVTSERLEHVKRLMQGGVLLPPVKLYQIKEQYYVVDGHHRVSAAKALGHQSIEAQIVEFIPSPNTLENIIYREKIEFFEKTGLHCSIELTEVGQYQHLLDQIQSHQQFLEQSRQQPVLFEASAADWYETIYQPLVTLIQRGRLLASFPQRTLADLYTYISFQQWQTGQSRTYSKEIDHLIPNNMEEFRKTMLAKREDEYPEMQREITVFVLINVVAKRESRIIEKLFTLKEVRELHCVHGNVDIIAKILLTRDLLSSDTETISYFVDQHIRKMPGIINTQTLIPALSKMKEG